MGKVLTDVVCRTATSNDRPLRKIADGGGLFLWVYANGNKSFRFRYKFHGKEKSLTIGTYPGVTLLAARRKTLEAAEKLAEGIDPSAAKKLASIERKIESLNTFELVAWEWYEKQVASWAPSHGTDVRRRIQTNIIPFIGDRPIAQITGPELLAMISKMEKRGAFDLAHRVLGVCGQIFRYGIATGRCAFDLSAALKGALTPHTAKNQNAIRPQRVPILMQSIAKYHLTGDYKTQLGLQLLAHTFLRTTELLAGEWSEIDFDRNIWSIPAERMKANQDHLVPMSKQVIQIMVELKKLSGLSKYILPGRNIMVPVSNNTLLFALYRMGYKGKMTGHGFRSVASTILNESGFKSDVIEKQLAHTEKNKVRRAYNRAEYWPERQVMMQWWSDYLEAAEKRERLDCFHGRGIKRGAARGGYGTLRISKGGR
ncbi:tyrosine-type recombinase/integrase [Methylobacillus gramineus]|uniref:tyrosine-type recombinase/integrase n=1 Tax=Methylobacillus gramineus TaxID=755169 RepID=UPI001CFFAF0F|nr:integrase arm-type DNA-binding domain-containing protein [Methylobacillus gramineus]MCB5184424.1 tyrosine-type recombinase/integrase [Methylobacillus gramineus]